MELLNASGKPDKKPGTHSKNDSEDTVEEFYTEDPQTALVQRTPKKMKVVDYLKTLFPSTSTFVPQTGTRKIGNTFFIINGRVLAPQENYLSGKRVSYKKNRSVLAYVWSALPPEQQKIPIRAIAPHVSGAIGAAREIETELAAFHLYFTENILNTILEHTNDEIKIAQYYIVPAPTCAQPLTMTELKAFIGMLYLSAVKKDNKIPTSFLWGVCGSDIYSAVMSKERFEYLNRCLRFDEYSTRDMKRKRDSFSDIRVVWDEFILKCSEMFRPSLNCTIDEMFIEFYGACNFKVPLFKQSERQGMRLILLCDAVTRYIISGIPFLDKNKNGPTPLAEYIVEKLTSSIHRTNTNISYGNDWFNSVTLSSRMLKLYKLTSVGPLHKNNTEVPSELFLTEDRPKSTSITLYNAEDELQICSYFSDAGEIEILLSSINTDPVFEEPESKPEIKEFYDATKSGVDAINKMRLGYTCSRQTRYWFITIFYTILDLAGINAYTIFNMNRSRYGKPSIRRSDFLYKLALDLMIPHMKERLKDKEINESLKNTIKNIIEERQKLCNVSDTSNPKPPDDIKMKLFPPNEIDKSKPLAINDVNTDEFFPKISNKEHHYLYPAKYRESIEYYTPRMIDINPAKLKESIEYSTSNVVKLWNKIRSLYPADSSRNPIPAVSTTSGSINNQSPSNVMVKIFQALYPPVQPNTQSFALVPFMKVEWTPSIIFTPQMQIVYSPLLSIIPIQVPFSPYQHTYWNPAGLAMQQMQARYSSNQSVQAQSTASALDTRQNPVTLAVQQIRTTNPVSAALRSNIAGTSNFNNQQVVPMLQYNAAQTKFPSIQTVGPPQPPSGPIQIAKPTQSTLFPNTQQNQPIPVMQQFNQPALQNILLPKTTRQTDSELKKELCACGVCNAISEKKFFVDCARCSVSLCFVHRKTQCTDCFNSFPTSQPNKIMNKGIVGANGKCGLCVPQGLINFSVQCCKCSHFLCLEHRRMVCLFCTDA